MFKPFLLTALFFPVAAIAAPINTDAQQAIILDFETGIVLFEKDARRPMPPASMTKIMTAFMVFEALERGDITEDTKFRVSEDAWRRGGVASGSSTMFLDLNSEVSVIDLLRGVIIQSGNDACIVLAEGLAGSESAFADRMTERAREMGLDSATFRNATGWPDEEHEISALDLAQLTRNLIESFPQYYGIYSERSFTWNGIEQNNRNPLLGRVDGADGVKTGSTSVSGYGVVGSAQRNGDRIITVINGLDSAGERRRVAAEIMETAFRDYDVISLYSAGTYLDEVPTYMGKAETVPTVLREDVVVAFARRDRDNIAARIEYTVVPAPIAAGDKVAELVVMNDSDELARYPLYATQAVERKGFMGRAMASLLQKIRG